MMNRFEALQSDISDCLRSSDSHYLTLRITESSQKLPHFLGLYSLNEKDDNGS